MEQFVANKLQATPGQGRVDAAPASGRDDEFGTLMLDRMGRIVSCGAPVERIFGASRGRLMGRQISEFIVGLLLGGSSLCYRAKYLAYLCAGDSWRQFAAQDITGRAFAVEVSVSQMAPNSHEMFLLTVRLPNRRHATPCDRRRDAVVSST